MPLIYAKHIGGWECHSTWQSAIRHTLSIMMIFLEGKKWLALVIKRATGTRFVSIQAPTQHEDASRVIFSSHEYTPLTS
jgi:hypothetical protein